MYFNTRDHTKSTVKQRHILDGIHFSGLISGRHEKAVPIVIVRLNTS